VNEIGESVLSNILNATPLAEDVDNDAEDQNLLIAMIIIVIILVIVAVLFIWRFKVKKSR
jgi:heme/copper-type cytochrome/quinol oxidase subunit 2